MACCRREVMQTDAPSSRNRSAMHLPNPPDPPVITHIRLDRQSRGRKFLSRTAKPEEEIEQNRRRSIFQSIKMIYVQYTIRKLDIVRYRYQ